ncbi:MAG: TIGR03013 family XrtA/PEP-CTERM system glycosyltransferase [Aquisalimonadaceae bacterium]
MIRLFNHYVPRSALVIAGFTALILVFLIYLVLLLWPGHARYPVWVGLAAALLVVTLERLSIFRWKGGVPALPGRALVLGAGTRAAQVDAQGSRGAGTTRSIVGYLPINEVHCDVPADRIVARGAGESLWQLAHRYAVTEIIVGVRERRNGGLPIQDLLECKLRGIRVTDLSSFFEREEGQVPLESLNSSWLIFGDGFRRGWWRSLSKRLFDVLFSVVLLIIASPVMLMAALAILLTMGRPILYWQERVGQDGQVFHICKFRSMRKDAEGDGKARWAQQNDNRVTPLGRILRKLRIDELPQIYNVLIGEMSFVGPRPERPQFVSKLARELPFYHTRHSVKPGITGWAQVCYPYAASLEATRGKLQYDLYYVKNGGLLLDLGILLRTVEVVLWGRGSR